MKRTTSIVFAAVLLSVGATSAMAQMGPPKIWIEGGGGKGGCFDGCVYVPPPRIEPIEPSIPRGGFWRNPYGKPLKYPARGPLWVEQARKQGLLQKVEPRVAPGYRQRLND
jgi:hypothetical protein